MIHKNTFICLFIGVKKLNCNKEDFSDSIITEPLIDSTTVSKNGLLRVLRNKIVNKRNVPISLARNSFFWSKDNWGHECYYTPETVKWLKNDWNTIIVIAAMGVDEQCLNKPSNKNRVRTIFQSVIDQGIYVMIDWHSHHAEDFTKEPIIFFDEMANLYVEHKNIIYKIYNEPLDISWRETLEPYAVSVIGAIRKINPDNLIVVGTPEWSSQVDLAAEDPITEYTNIAYTLHFYSIYHHEWLTNRASEALNSGIALFVTKWCSLGYITINTEANEWMNWCFRNKITHLNWAVNDKEEESSILKPETSQLGGWSQSDLTNAGKLAKNIISNWPQSNCPLCSLFYFNRK